MAAEALLVCHPDSPSRAVLRVKARVARRRGTLEVSYLIEGQMQALRIPEPRAPRIAERLWQHTCCEMFVAEKDSAAYHEFNFSPSGEWAAYAFAGYRAGAVPCGEELAPGIAVERSTSSMLLECRVRVAAGRNTTLGLCAVIEELDGRLSYWAIRHPPGKADFHHRDAFALELDEVRH